jgi:hypothetical protein
MAPCEIVHRAAPCRNVPVTFTLDVINHLRVTYTMDQAKRDRLVASLASETEGQLVSIETFFDGNDDLGSIGCNLIQHPGVEVFRATFERLASRQDVEAIYAQIAEVDPGEDCWPFTDTIFVVGAIPVGDLAAELAALKPDEVGSATDFGIPTELETKYPSPVLVAWWD